MKLSNTFLAVLASLLLTSCFKDPIIKPVEPKLPEATQQGLNTFGCYKNGELWLVSSTFYGPKLWSNYDIVNNQMWIAGCKGDECLDIYINFDKITLSNTFFFVDTINYVIFSDNNSKCAVNNIRAESSYMQISRFDTVENVISGTFQIYFPDSCGVANSFTEGRFDLEFTKN